jgi:glutaconate CoA-transferase subunit B
VDYITSPGWLDGGDSRRKAGLVNGGPSAVVTTMGLLRFHPDSKAMYLASYHPGLSAQKVVEQTGFPLDIEYAIETASPIENELRILREEVDPERIFLK